MMVGLSLEPAATSAMVVLLYEITKTNRQVNNSEVTPCHNYSYQLLFVAGTLFKIDLLLVLLKVLLL